MLDGKKGSGARKAMEILVAYGECYNAERLIPITSVHMAGNFPVLLDEGIEWLEDLAQDGTKVSVYTTKNPEMFDFEEAEELRIPKIYQVRQKKIDTALRSLGVTLNLFVPPLFGGKCPSIRGSYCMGFLRKPSVCQLRNRGQI